MSTYKIIYPRALSIPIVSHLQKNETILFRLVLSKERNENLVLIHWFNNYTILFTERKF